MNKGIDLTPIILSDEQLQRLYTRRSYGLLESIDNSLRVVVIALGVITGILIAIFIHM